MCGLSMLRCSRVEWGLGSVPRKFFNSAPCYPSDAYCRVWRMVRLHLVTRITIPHDNSLRVSISLKKESVPCVDLSSYQKSPLRVLSFEGGACAPSVLEGVSVRVKVNLGGSRVVSNGPVALSSLNSVISHPNALQPDHVMVHDVAVSALGKICYFHYDNIKEAEVLSTWLSHLPITNLLNEAKVAHQYLCRVVERTKTEPLSVYLPSIIRVFAEILWAGSNLATAQTVSQMIGLLKDSKQTLPTEWASICSSLVPQRKNFLQAILPDT
ncbi:hypothetical protein CK203_019626 [Vitis vinifera]|uniref:Uncharacterized protein n=1 Tax=Vitis vinifera TaxID=29760 RepID=A0A438JR12_VITVI|nr:hypothetical protein CK203_019626 [Vitis vinifera]